MHSQTNRVRRSAAKGPVQLSGLTLIELLVVLAIVGILLAIGLPSYQQYVMKGRRADAIKALNEVVQAQERYRSSNSSYANSLTTLYSTTTAPDLAQHYDMTLSGVSASGFTIAASPKTGGLQTQDTVCATIKISLAGGALTYSSLNSAAASTTSSCWPK
ncbi:type IV pilin protein [Paucibacter sp. APW11]|uniref:Type IV pilin protein n=1 Tax=Roseateles aquae TaxID=3077235 RepID=A0ABU3P826_9BURK|nr:type IV pilin protein [Paucibacter sp. APW11]MDT8998721.1 type IV pilin protein [Paucibacter sp. APW11]